MITGQEVKWLRSWCNGGPRGYCHIWTIRQIVQVHSIGYTFALTRKGYDNHNCLNKPQIGNMAGVWMMSCPEVMVLRIFEMQLASSIRIHTTWEPLEWSYWKETDRHQGLMSVSMLCLDMYALSPIVNTCRIHRLLFCWGWRPNFQRVSCLWQSTIWWWGSNIAGALGNAKYPFIAIAPKSTQSLSSSTW